MTDISKCHGDNCEVKEQCYRFTARTHPHWQSWIETPPMKPCELFVEDEWEQETVLSAASWLFKEIVTARFT